MPKYKSGGTSKFKLAVGLFLLLFLPLAVFYASDAQLKENRSSAYSTIDEGGIGSAKYQIFPATFIDKDGDGKYDYTVNESCYKGHMVWTQDGQRLYDSGEGEGACSQKIWTAKVGKCTVVGIIPPSGYTASGWSYSYSSNRSKYYYGVGSKVKICAETSNLMFGFRREK